MDTIGAPHSSIAARACSTGIRCFSSVCGCWILPQPAHFRLHANSGSSSTSSGNFLFPVSFWRIRYDPMRRLWRSGHAHDCLTSLGSPNRMVLSGDHALADLDRAEAAQRGDDVLDHRRGRGRARGQPDADAPASQPSSMSDGPSIR